MNSTNGPIPAIALQDLCKTFAGPLRAVDHLSMRVFPGESVALMGANGSGKSTTLKLILGLLQPSSGKVLLLGESPDNPRARAHAGYLPERDAFYPFLSGEETLRWWGRFHGMKARTVQNRVAYLLHTLGLEKAAGRPAGTYSRGMRRRLGLARALIHDPKILLLDEPAEGLDPAGAGVLADLLAQLKAEGKAIVMTSHRRDAPQESIDRVLILNRGRVAAEGPLHTLLESSGSVELRASGLGPEGLGQARKVLEGLGAAVTLHPSQRSLESLLAEMNASEGESGV